VNRGSRVDTARSMRVIFDLISSTAVGGSGFALDVLSSELGSASFISTSFGADFDIL
jgi:hypothetical protein